MARAKIHYKASSTTPKTASVAVGKMSGRVHRHCCVSCRMTYTDNCTSPGENGRCYGCRTDRERALWDRNHDPADCCASAQQVLDPNEILRYSLAGTGPWYRCSECGRSNGFIPKRRLT